MILVRSSCKFLMDSWVLIHQKSALDFSAVNSMTVLNFRGECMARRLMANPSFRVSFEMC